jgi:hypothetical protein
MIIPQENGLTNKPDNKTDLEGIEYVCGMHLLGIGYKRVVGSC